jgi:ABC-type multidrug transport system fused ATPase/permease subunit
MNLSIRRFRLPTKFNFFNDVGATASYHLLTRKERIKLSVLVFWQLLSSFLDIVGVVLTGSIAALATSSRKIDFSFLDWIPFLRSETLHNSDQLLLIMSGAALLLFAAKSFFAIYFTRETYKLLSKIQSRISDDVIAQFFHRKYESIKIESSAEISFIMNFGLTAAVTNCLSQNITLISEFVLLSLMLMTLAMIDPAIAIGALAYFVTIAVVLNNVVSPKVRKLGEVRSRITIGNQSKLVSVLALYREIRVLGRQRLFENELRTNQSNIAEQAGKNMWLQQLPKYVMELSLVFGLFLLIAMARFFVDPSGFIQIVAIYLIASARLYPSLLRIQSSILTLKSSSRDSRMALEFISKMRSGDKGDRPAVKQSEVEATNRNLPDITISNMSFRYSGQSDDLLKDVSMEIVFGSFTILMGQSGSGKSTLCDLILGLLDPSKGSIHIAGNLPGFWVKENPGMVSYMTQDTNIVSGTILENICLGIDYSEIDFERVDRILMESKLEAFVSELSQGIHTHLNSNAQGLSGGQKQRIGIARALYSNPKILVFDESTNALDLETQREFMQILRSVSDRRTVIFIAHNMMTIEKSDSIVYFEGGKTLGPMNLESMSKTSPAFCKLLLDKD